RILGAGLSARASGDGTDRLAGGAGLLAAVERGTASSAVATTRHGAVPAGGVGSAAHRGRRAGDAAGGHSSLPQPAVAGRDRAVGSGVDRRDGRAESAKTPRARSAKQGRAG